jgi:hypothetical protein
MSVEERAVTLDLTRPTETFPTPAQLRRLLADALRTVEVYRRLLPISQRLERLRAGDDQLKEAGLVPA